MIRRWAAACAAALLASAPSFAHAQNEAAREALEHYRSLRPAESDLAVYRLDWVNSIDEAKKRAAKENRPILMVAIHARYGDVYTGHC